jgi:hypothetical protein
VEAAVPWVCRERRGILGKERNPKVKWLFAEQRESLELDIKGT